MTSPPVGGGTSANIAAEPSSCSVQTNFGPRLLTYGAFGDIGNTFRGIG